MLLKEKIKQTVSILKEKDIDVWITFVRESGINPDPVLEYIMPVSFTWESAIIITKTGRKTAIVGEFDATSVENLGVIDEVITYRGGIKEKLIKILTEINPKKIAINYSLDDPTADGLSHGLYLKLLSYLKDTPFSDVLISAQEIISTLRSRKTETELKLIKNAIKETEKLFEKLTENLKPGMTEIEIAEMLKGWMKEIGGEPAWEEKICPSVFAGPQKRGAHSAPTENKLMPGHILNIDFGIKLNGYVSDLQRVWYVLKEGEESPPKEVIKAFATVRTAIENARKELKPGRAGFELDKIARDTIVKEGYEEYPHALGHQVGRSAHDGAALLAPLWERYGKLPYIKLEEGMVFTLEPRINLKEYGVISLEEIAIVTKDGGEYLSTPQEELFLIKS